MNFNPKVWGRNAWNFIHFVALGYPNQPTNEQKEFYKMFFKSLTTVLPCKKCRTNYSRHFKKYKIDNYLGSSKQLFQWTVMVRNAIQRDLGKHDDQMKVDPLREHFMDLQEKASDSYWAKKLMLTIATASVSLFTIILYI